VRSKTIVAIVLIVLGIGAFAYQGITYTTRGRGMDLTSHVPLPPIFGAIALIGGIALLLADGRDLKPTATRR